jgi:hypothetical protein
MVNTGAPQAACGRIRAKQQSYALHSKSLGRQTKYIKTPDPYQKFHLN